MIKIICILLSFLTCLNFINSQTDNSDNTQSTIFQEDFSFKVKKNDKSQNLSQENEGEFLDAGSIIFPLSISEKSKESSSQLTINFNENTSDILIDISNIYLISDHYDPENAVIIELSSNEKENLKVDFLYHGTLDFINYLSPTSIEVKKSIQENLIIYIKEVPKSLSIKIFPKKVSTITSANIEIASIQKLKQTIPLSTQFSDLDLCNISKINIFMDNSMSFENEQRVDLIEYIQNHLNQQDNTHQYKVNFYSLFENKISEPLLILDLNQKDNLTDNLNSKIDEIIKIEGKYLEWTELKKFTLDKSNLNILFTDGIPNGKNGNKTDSVDRLEDLIATKGFLFVNPRFQYDNSEYLEWYSVNSFKTEFQNFLDSSCPFKTLTQTDLRIFPNPVKSGNYLFLEGKINHIQDQMLDGRILDLSGKVIQHLEIPVKNGIYETSIFLKDLTSGFYFIELATKDNETIQVSKLSVL